MVVGVVNGDEDEGRWGRMRTVLWWRFASVGIYAWMDGCMDFSGCRKRALGGKRTHLEKNCRSRQVIEFVVGKSEIGVESSLMMCRWMCFFEDFFGCW